MDKFFDPCEIGRAVHAQALATLRGHAIDKAGLVGLAREILAQASPYALEDPDEVVDEALSDFLGAEWELPAGEDYVDPIEAIGREAIDTATLVGAMKVLNRTERPSTPACAYDVYGDLTLLMVAVFWALYLTLDIRPNDAAHELSQGRVAPPEAPAALQFQGENRNGDESPC